MTEREHFEKLDEIRARFAAANEKNILSIQREFNAALDEFRKWAKENPARVPAETFAAKSECVIHRFEFVGPSRIRFL